MSYHILEVRKVDRDGRVLSREFFIVNAAGEIVSGPDGGPFASFAQALGTLEKLVERAAKRIPPRRERDSYDEPGM